MDNASSIHIWVYRGIFLGVAAFIILIQLLPLDTLPPSIPPPDVLPVLTFAWVLRRPEYVPIALIALIFLLADLFFMRPPGLWAALIVMGSEVLRSRGLAFREMPFIFEWALVAAVITAITLANQVALAITVSQAPGLGPSLIQMVLTILLYPAAAIATRILFKVRRPTPGELSARRVRM